MALLSHTDYDSHEWSCSYEASSMACPRNVPQAEQLFDRSLRTCLYAPLWQAYVDYVKKSSAGSPGMHKKVVRTSTLKDIEPVTMNAQYCTRM